MLKGKPYMNKKLSKISIILISVLVISLFCQIYNISSPKYLDYVIIVQAHSDDFDFSLFGQSLIYQKLGSVIVVVTVTDCQADMLCYDYAVSNGLIQPDAMYNETFQTSNGNQYTRPFCSPNVGMCRINSMECRYSKWNIVSVRPSTPAPDGIGSFSDAVKNSFIASIVPDLTDKISKILTASKSEGLKVIFYIHDPEVNEHGDHVFSGYIGIQVYQNLKGNLVGNSFKLKAYYVYTSAQIPIQGYMYVDVSSVYTKKLQFFNSIWEANASKINLKNWHK
ncbi:MAG: hypothetical protein QXM25_02230, partial [Nitrososphaerales archaeon]